MPKGSEHSIINTGNEDLVLHNKTHETKERAYELGAVDRLLQNQ